MTNNIKHQVVPSAMSPLLVSYMKHQCPQQGVGIDR